MTVEDLKAQYGHLVNQIIVAAREGMVEKSYRDIATAVSIKRAASNECNRILDLHNVVFGAEATKRFRMLVEAGVTAEQAKLSHLFAR